MRHQPDGKSSVELKGSVQMLFPLSQKTSYLKLTTSHYYLPSGRCIHREENSSTWGVDPDVTIEMTPKQMREANLARQDQEVIHRGETHGETKATGGAAVDLIEYRNKGKGRE